MSHRGPPTCLLLVSLLAACAGAPPNTQPTPDLVQLQDGRLGWAGLYLGERHESLETRTHQTFVIAPQSFPACGQFSTETTLYGRHVTLQWSADAKDAGLDSIYVDLGPGATGAGTMSDGILHRLPGLKPFGGQNGSDSAALSSSRNEVVLIKSGAEHFLLLSPAGCLD
jgi:hypothetical protein